MLGVKPSAGREASVTWSGRAPTSPLSSVPAAPGRLPVSDRAAVVERYLSALARQDWAALAACLAPDVERIGPYGDVYRGRDPYIAFLRETLAGLPGYVLHVERSIVTPDVVVAQLHETVDTAQGRRRTHEAVVFDLNSDGLIRGVAVFLRRSAIVA